jgi:hypothetical protein
MERRHFRKLAIGFAVGATALAAIAQAAPLVPQPLVEGTQANQSAHPAVTTGDEVDRLRPQEVWWGHGHHWGWRHHHRHWRYW